MIMNRGNVETALDELGHYRLDLGFEQDQIAHHHGLAAHSLAAHSLAAHSLAAHSLATHTFECDPAAKRKRRLNAHAVERDVKIAAWETVAMNVAGHDRRLSADRVIDFLPVNFLALRRRRRNQASTNQKHISKPNHLLPIAP